MFSLLQTSSLTVQREEHITDSDLRAIADKIGSAPGSELPTRKDLNQWEIYDEQMSLDAALKLGLPVASASGTYATRVVVRDVRRFVRREEEGGVVAEYGVALRMVVRVSAKQLDLSLTLPMIAAQATLGMVAATARLQVMGSVDSAIGDLLPSFEELDVNSYSKYTQAVDDIRKYLAKHEEGIFPVLLRKVLPADSTEAALINAMATAYALKQIARRRSLDDALAETPSDWDSFTLTVRGTYDRFGAGSASSERPSSEVAGRADSWVSLIS